MPGLMAIREEFAPQPAAARRAHRRLAAHDHPDRGADRDAAGARRRGALGFVQHLLDPGSCRRRHRGARHAGVRLQGRDARPSTGNSRTASSSGRTSAHANMILDDGGDATLLLHLGARAEKDAIVISQARPARKRPRCSTASAPRSSAIRTGIRRASAAIRGVSEETTTGVKRLYQMAQRRAARLPGHQRQRLGHQVASSTTSTAAANRWSTASSAPPT